MSFALLCQDAMDQEFLIRIGTKLIGRATGAEIREMVAQGRFGKLHQVSVDGSRWEPATSYPEFFGAYAEPTTQLPTSTSAVTLLEMPHAHDAPVTDVAQPHELELDAEEATWQVIVESEQFGPYTTLEVQQFVADRRIAKGDQVWRDGMEDWLPAEKMFRSVRRRKTPKEKKPKKEKPRIPREEQSRSILAVASFISALLWGLGIGSLIAVILGILALIDIASSRGYTIGIWFAVLGVLLGLLGTTCGAYLIHTLWLN